MRVLVVYESIFGNTQQVAQAVADGLAAHAQVELVEVGQAESGLGDAPDLLVVGAPTQIMGLSKPNSRASAAKQATTGVVSQGIGLREWLDKLPADGAAVPAAAFDTRLNKSSWLTGSAARSAEKTLRKLHHPIAVKAESFLVAGTPGPLLDGEVERARAWGEKLGASLAPAGSR